MIFVTSGVLFKNDDADMEQKIEIWNSIVGEKDTVYCLGDFAIEPNVAMMALSKMLGKVIFLTGVKDEPMHFLRDSDGINVKDTSLALINKQKTVLSYWCLNDWHNKDKDYYQIFGKPCENKPKNSICAAWDLWKRPMKLVDLIDFIKQS